MLNGHLLNDRYEIKETIGGGGMANVYLGRDTILNRDVAIKVLRLEYANDDEFIARFRREAHSATSLSHPNIVNIYDVGEEEHIYYMVMEYVDGMTLKQYIQSYGPLDVQESLDITKQITAAITHAHDNHIVHRDIKPQNILIDEYKQVKVTDFGIAMALSATSLTQTNSVLGSVHYLSPEQARGGMATKKSDIYSIGIVLFEMLTGRLPFSGQSPVSIALKHLQSETPSMKRWNPNVPQSVENIVLKATAKDPFHRYGEISEIDEDIETAMLPERQDEPKFSVPLDDDEEVTKAIPIITNDAYQSERTEDTIIHQTDHTEVRANSEPESPEKQPSKKKRKWKGWVFGILFTLIGAGVLALFLIPAFMIPDDVEVTDVSGLEYEEALSQLMELNLKVNREGVNSNEVEEGKVIRTEPEAGSTVKEGSEITVYSSLGKEKEEFKDYAGSSYEETKKELEEKGYKNIYPNFENSSEYEEGMIISNANPIAGEMVLPEETPVVFRVSSGPEEIDVPGVTGSSIEEAKSTLGDKLKLEEAGQEFSTSVPKGQIIRQEPSANQEVVVGSTVKVWVSKGQEPPSYKTITKEYTVEVEQNSTQDDDQSEGTTGEDNGGQGEQNEQPQAPVEKTVKIYIDDENETMDTPYIDETITKTKTFTIPLRVKQGSPATYRVDVDGDTVKKEEVSYEEGEAE
ncbi:MULTISPECIES: Stk1 family PASTA domain-containing Ser/Thr kinase [Pontibacillus]|uniref:non-specific serine/threonine protein kinase n=1 Tax=Pontibacillus chungwhensis TaxID=265426 RepID=A0ABY8V4H2_9BACI|nr:MULTISPECIES: Stk1 family PASTA domain-containing Ser/Thr kinase [Pontibacillus]MCD5322635.1 Stk1 family PASTA domain-containing Ser/Thr kinase [Pontibacillus sp. HN14]WIF99916.1 Stk1 family PASTA domain-containing Ser/Thr kinase [Pontibacillus chungwhensis]